MFQLADHAIYWHFGGSTLFFYIFLSIRYFLFSAYAYYNITHIKPNTVLCILGNRVKNMIIFFNRGFLYYELYLQIKINSRYYILSQILCINKNCLIIRGNNMHSVIFGIFKPFFLISPFLYYDRIWFHVHYIAQ